MKHHEIIYIFIFYKTMEPTTETITRTYTYTKPNGKIITRIRTYEVKNKNIMLPSIDTSECGRRKDNNRVLSEYMLKHKDTLINSTYDDIAEHVNKDKHLMSKANIAKLWNKIIGPRNTKKKTEDEHHDENKENVITYGKQ